MKDRIDRIEALFGYPFSPAIRKRIEAEIDDPDTAPAETDGAYVGSLVHWKGEYLDGPDPERAAVEALFKRLNKPVPAKALREKEPNLLARHFAGLLELEAAETTHTPQGIRTNALWLADLNPRSDVKSLPVYRLSLGGEPVGPFLFESPQRFDAYQKAVKAIGSLFEEEVEEKKPALVSALLADFAWAAKVEMSRLTKLRVLEKQHEGIEAQPPKDPYFERLNQVLPLLEVEASHLVAMADSPEPRKLPPAMVKQALSVAGDTRDWPPGLMLRLQALALSADADEGRREAEHILQHKEGVALTQRWADRILRKLPPYDR